MAVEACEHIVVLNKRDLVPEWGVEPFRRAMEKKFPHQKTIFASWQRPRDIRNLSEILVKIAKEYPHAMETNVLVIGMPNVGKSTLLNTLRSMGIKGPTPKAFQTSANPGMTRALSTRLKLSVDPLVYAYDTPGVMLPFLGRGDEGAERGIKLALIAGIKEGLYDMEALAAYLLYRLNILDPLSPGYLRLLAPGTAPTPDLEHFLTMLALRMGMLGRGGIPDTERAAKYFVRWWREEGALISASVGRMDSLFEKQSPSPTVCNDEAGSIADALASPSASVGGGFGSIPSRTSPSAGPLAASPTTPTTPGEAVTQAWGFDFQWEVSPSDLQAAGQAQVASASVASKPGKTQLNEAMTEVIQKKMEQCIENHMAQTDKEELEGGNASQTQVKRKMMMDEKERRKEKQAKARRQ